MDAITTALTAQVTSITPEATAVCVAGIGLGAIFFAAKLLWKNFRSVAKGN